MNTFLPYPCFACSVKALDDKRLNAQRREAHQIIKVIEAKNRGEIPWWYHHPAVLMWEGYIDALKAYANAAVAEWMHRGYKNSYEYLDYALRCSGTRVLSGVKPSAVLEYMMTDVISIQRPFWFGNPRFHDGHRASLRRKLPERYDSFWPDVDPTLSYWWPVRWDRKLQRAVECSQPS